jgi:hypothetical protein
MTIDVAKSLPYHFRCRALQILLRSSAIRSPDEECCSLIALLALVLVGSFTTIYIDDWWHGRVLNLAHWLRLQLTKLSKVKMTRVAAFVDLRD